MIFLRIYKHTLPKAKAWLLTPSKQLREFFQGLTGIGEDFKSFDDNIYNDIFPTTTREINAWEDEFGIITTLPTEQERRDRLDAKWKALGGQSPRYIQDTLQSEGFDVYIHPFWDEPLTEPPVVRNPLTYLNDGTGVVQYIMNDGAAEANDGNLESNDGASANPTGFVLVNKLLLRAFIGDGSLEMNDGAVTANDGASFNEYTQKSYVVTDDPTKWPYFLYIGGQTFPEHAIVPASRRNEFETLCLKICPAQQWLGMLIDYT